MRFTIWRVSPGGSAFQITTAGATSVKERALEKAQMFNERLLASEPDSEDRFVVRDNRGREFKLPEPEAIVEAEHEKEPA